jgi:hypothetical protein
MSQAQDHTSPVLLAKLLAGKATDEERRALEAHAAACPGCRDELVEARAAGRRFTESVFPRTLPAVEARGRRRAWRLLFPIAPLALAAAATAAVLLVRHPPVLPEVQYKGAAALQVFAHRGGESFPVRDGMALRAGDRIRFGVVPGDARFVLVGSVDGRGHASIYQPSTPVEAGKEPLLVLPDSIVLDDAPGPERIFAVFSEQRVENTQVADALTALGARGADAIRGATRLPLPYTQASVLLEKDAAPPPP